MISLEYYVFLCVLDWCFFPKWIDLMTDDVFFSLFSFIHFVISNAHEHHSISKIVKRLSLSVWHCGSNISKYFFIWDFSPLISHSLILKIESIEQRILYCVGFHVNFVSTSAEYCRFNGHVDSRTKTKEFIADEVDLLFAELRSFKMNKRRSRKSRQIYNYENKCITMRSNHKMYVSVVLSSNHRTSEISRIASQTNFK